jgi:tripartite-type tricarboxylate transporter receptor subunit TctC
VKAAKILTVCLVALAGLSLPGRAQTKYPSRLITIIAPISPGTAIDILARLYAEKLSSKFGWRVVVEDRPGAAGAVGGEYVSRAPANGYTLICANSGLTFLRYTNKNLKFDPLASFSGVAIVGQAPAVVTVSPQLGVKDLKAFVALAKAKPGTLNYGSAGVGSATHLAGAYFAQQTGIDLVHVPYADSTAILSDLLGGRIQASFVPAAFVAPLLKEGKLRGLAVAADESLTEPVKIPTALSQGVDYHFLTWYGLLAPAHTPKAILNALHEAISSVSQDPLLIARMTGLGLNPQDEGPDAFDATIHKQITDLTPVLNDIANARSQN